MIKKIWAYIRSLFVSDIVEEPPRTFRKTYTKRQKKDLGYGVYGSIKELLNDLDRSFADLSAAAKHNENITVFGTHLVAAGTLSDDVSTEKLEEGFSAYGLPSFISGYFPTTEGYHSTINWALKSGRIAHVELCKKGVIYEVGTIYIEKGIAYGYRTYVSVTDDGSVYPLRVRTPRSHSIQTKKGRVNYSTCDWHYDDLRNEDAIKLGDSKTDFIRKVFVSVYNSILTKERFLRVIVERDGLKLTVSIPNDQWKYFFKDRIHIRTKTGRKKRIFHAVASHIRKGQTKESPVKTHYRGLKDFKWKGYKIKIRIPGKDVRSMSEFGVAAVDPNRNSDTDLVSPPELKKILGTSFE